MLSSPVAAQSPPQGLPKFGSGLNSLAVDRGLIGIRKRYASNVEIFGDGEPAEYLYEVVLGLIRSCKTLGNGRRQITGLHMPREVFGLELADEHHLSAEAVSDAITERLSAVPSWDLRHATHISPVSFGPRRREISSEFRTISWFWVL